MALTAGTLVDGSMSSVTFDHAKAKMGCRAMPDKASERRYFEVLRQLMTDFPQGEIVEPEPPDFVVVATGRCLGVELTVFHLPAREGEPFHQEQRSLQERTVALAERLFLARGGAALYVSVWFSGRIRKCQVRPLAKAIANAVRATDLPRSFKQGSVDVGYKMLPDPVTDITVRASLDGTESLWQAPLWAWAAPISARDLQDAIDAKAEMYQAARRHCHELWLVIVHDHSSNARPAEFSEGVLDASYRFPFGRVLILSPHVPRVVELRPEPTATSGDLAIP